MVANYTLKLERTQAPLESSHRHREKINTFFTDLKNNFLTGQVRRLPKNPGVYIFKKGREFLYIGKAANLRERVKQHRGTAVLSRVKHIAYIETASEIEALVLEAELIKRHKPKYNVLWRDDKNYFYAAVTKEKFSRLFITHQTKAQSEKRKAQNHNSKLKTIYVGPFVDGGALKQTLKYLRKVFPYYTARKHPLTRCPWCYLELCPGPNPDLKKYKNDIKNLVKVLKGQKRTVLLQLRKEMLKASQKQDFEKAALLRNQIVSLEKVMAHGKVFDDAAAAAPRPRQRYRRVEGYDVANFQGKFATGVMVVFTKGQPDKKEYRKFKIRWAKTPNDIAMLKEVLCRRFSHPEWPFPDLIVVDGGKAQLNAALLTTKNYKLKTKVIALTKDSRHKGVKIYENGKKESRRLSELAPGFRNLLLQVDSEAHRFAVSYHRKLHRKIIPKT